MFLAEDVAVVGGAFGEFVGDGIAGTQGVDHHRVEVHEPAFEQRMGHGLQRLVHPPVQFNLVIQCAKDVGNGALFGEGRNSDWKVAQMPPAHVWKG